MADETKGYRVSYKDGTEARDVRVPLRAPITKKVRRHFETVRETADGRKRLDFELREVDVSIDVESEMRADAIRSWNEGRGSAIAAKNLNVEALPDLPAAATEAPRVSRRQTPAIAASE